MGLYPGSSTCARNRSNPDNTGPTIPASESAMRIFCRSTDFSPPMGEFTALLGDSNVRFISVLLPDHGSPHNSIVCLSCDSVKSNPNPAALFETKGMISDKQNGTNDCGLDRQIQVKRRNADKKTVTARVRLRAVRVSQAPQPACSGSSRSNLPAGTVWK